MNSLAWPNIFNMSNTNTNLYEYKKAIMSNLILLLNTERNTLFGDPYYGTSLSRILFEPNNTLISDLVVDEIYTAIQTYIPQIRVSRNDIQISRNKEELKVNIRVTYLLDNTSDLYSINLTNSIQEG